MEEKQKISSISDNKAEQFAGKYGIVTGATQDGLGTRVAELFARRGMAGVVVSGRNEANGQQLAEKLRSTGCNAHFLAADLVEVDACRALVAKADKEFGAVHVLVNSAGFTERGSILDTTPEFYDRMFAINTRAPFFLMQEAAKIMRREGSGGTIVNVLSIASYGSMPRLAPYVGSKAALGGMTKNAAFALMRDRIRINGLNLGWMDTPNEDLIQRTFHNAPDDWKEKAEQDLPLGKMIDPVEAAEIIAFMASSDSGIMTGSLVDYEQHIPGAFMAPPYPDALEDKY